MCTLTLPLPRGARAIPGTHSCLSRSGAGSVVLLVVLCCLMPWTRHRAACFHPSRAVCFHGAQTSRRNENKEGKMGRPGANLHSIKINHSWPGRAKKKAAQKTRKSHSGPGASAGSEQRPGIAEAGVQHNSRVVVTLFGILGKQRPGQRRQKKGSGRNSPCRAVQPSERMTHFSIVSGEK